MYLKKQTLCLKDIRNELVLHDLGVGNPVFAILFGAAFVVTSKAMEQKADHEEEVQVWDVRLKARDHSIEGSRHAPGEGQDPVTQVVRVTRETPPSRNEKLASSLGDNDLGRLTPDRALGVLLELVLLTVGASENKVTDAEDQDAQQVVPKRILARIEVDVPALNAVVIGDPNIVAPQKHPAESFLEDIPGSDNEVFQDEVVEDVQEVEEADDQHGSVDITKLVVLLGRDGEVDQHPPSKTRARFGEELDVKSDRVVVQRVKLNTEPQIVSEVADRDLLGRVLALNEQVECEDEREDVGNPEEFQEVFSQQGHSPVRGEAVTKEEEAQ